MEFDEKLQEIKKLNGILTIDGQVRCWKNYVRSLVVRECIQLILFFIFFARNIRQKSTI